MVQFDVTPVQGSAIGRNNHVSQHATRLHALQLAMVAEHDKTGAASQGGQQLVPQGQVQHRRLVDDHHVSG